MKLLMRMFIYKASMNFCQVIDVALCSNLLKN